VSIPTFRVEAAFASEPRAETYEWTDITDRVIRFDYQRGRTYDFDRVEAARGTCEVLDDLGAFDARNAGTLVNLFENPAPGSSLGSFWINENRVALASVTGQRDGGGYSAEATVSATGSSPQVGFRTSSGSRLSVTAGATYVLSVDAKMRSAYGTRNASIRVLYYDGSGVEVAGGNQGPNTVLTVDWQRIVRVLPVVPVGAVTARVLLYLHSSTASSGEVYDLKDVQFERASASSDYTDGSLDDCRWEGTANASRSYRGGPFYPNVKALKAVRQVATLDAVDYPCALLYFEGYPRQRAGSLVTRRCRLVDAFEFMATAGLAGESFSSQTTGARVTAVLDAIDWPAALRQISTGLNTVQAVTFGADDTTKALTHLQQMADDEDGIFFIDRRGYATFIDRQDLLGAPFNESVATFSENPGTGEYLCSITTADFDKKTVMNDLTGTRLGGTSQNAQDADSIDDYGRRSRQFTSLLADDDTQLAAMQFKLAKYKEPLERIERIEVLPGEDSDLWEVMLGLDVGSRITVIDTPPGVEEQEDEYIVQRIEFPRQPGSDAGARFVLSLWPADINNWFVLDDPIFGVLDANKIPY